MMLLTKKKRVYDPFLHSSFLNSWALFLKNLSCLSQWPSLLAGLHWLLMLLLPLLWAELLQSLFSPKVLFFLAILTLKYAVKYSAPRKVSVSTSHHTVLTVFFLNLWTAQGYCSLQFILWQNGISWTIHSAALIPQKPEEDLYTKQLLFCRAHVLCSTALATEICSQQNL